MTPPTVTPPAVTPPAVTPSSDDRDDAEAVVRGFLRDVRSGERPERAGRYLAARVRAHQGRPGAEHGVVTRTPEDYADHVRDMLRARGPWTFEVTGVEASDGYVEARWRQAGAVAAEGSARRRPVVEHGWARYRVRDGRIDEYWIDAREQAAPAPGEVLRYTAFSTDPGGGNPAGVVLDATGMTDAQMLATAAGVGFSETAFLLPGPDPVGVRYFSPRAEVSFCGHATIATAVAVAERSGAGRMRLATAAGQVEVVTDRADDGTWRATLTSVPPRTAPLEDADLRGLLSALRWSEADLDPGLPPRVAYAGAWHPVLAARTRARLRDLDYDREALADLMARRGWTTVDLVWRQDATTFVARNPFPPGGVVEDPATGAAAAALGGYLREGGHVGLPAVLTVRQGEDMGRPSVLTVEVPEDPGSGIRVSGSAVALPAAG